MNEKKEPSLLDEGFLELVIGVGVEGVVQEVDVVSSLERPHVLLEGLYEQVLGFACKASSQQERFVLAAVELNGAIYATGGFDGNDYLRSAERFDPRDHSWTKIPNMNGSRFLEPSKLESLLKGFESRSSPSHLLFPCHFPTIGSSLSPSPPQATAPKAYPPTTSSAPPPTTTTPPPLAPAPVSKTTLASSPPSTTPSSSSSFGPTASSPSNSPTDSPPALVSPSDSPVTSSPVVVSDGPADAPTLQLQICLRGLKGYGEKQSGEEATHFKCRFAYVA
ncbi:hypothetical protein JHK85_019132 [Glycine max]|nr:hypothetical protein JHK85_019132 [Glycine max]KAG5037877.1 hypothetical protein JHK86_018717 [Glycine max]